MQPIDTALVFADDYYPRVPFRITGRLPTAITVDILDGPGNRGVPVISQPDEYDGYVIRYGFAGGYTFLFARRYIPSGRRFVLGYESTYFSGVLNMIEAPLIPLRGGGRGGGPGGGDGGGGGGRGGGTGGGGGPEGRNGGSPGTTTSTP